jgi:hypothetical protein
VALTWPNASIQPSKDQSCPFPIAGVTVVMHCDQPRETLVHMVLMMAVEERWTGVVSKKINFGGRISRHAERVFH